jgi:hypothetical protein
MRHLETKDTLYPHPVVSLTPTPRHPWPFPLVAAFPSPSPLAVKVPMAQSTFASPSTQRTRQCSFLPVTFLPVQCPLERLPSAVLLSVQAFPPFQLEVKDPVAQTTFASPLTPLLIPLTPHRVWHQASGLRVQPPPLHPPSVLHLLVRAFLPPFPQEVKDLGPQSSSATLLSPPALQRMHHRHPSLPFQFPPQPIPPSCQLPGSY